MADQIQGNLMMTFLDKDKVMNEIKERPEVTAFAQKYPESYVQESTRRHNVSLEMIAYNFETGNNLRLDIRYEPWEDDIRSNIRCDVSSNSFRQSLGVHSTFASAAQSGSIGYPTIFLKEGHAENGLRLHHSKFPGFAH